MAQFKEMANYKPPKLVMGHRWYISWWVEGERRRETFGMNRIHDLEMRRTYANDKVNEIMAWLSAGCPDAPPAQRTTTLRQGIHLALQVKSQSVRRNSMRTYISAAKQLITWLELKGIDTLAVDDLTQSLVGQHLDYLQRDKAFKAVTFNNKLIHLRSLWNEMIQRGFAKSNPWTSIKMRREGDRIRRPLHKREMDIILSHALADNPYFALAILLIYDAAIRPAEIRRLKSGMFNLEQGVIHMPPDITKNGMRSTVTLSKSFRMWINTHVSIEGLHPGLYVIGEGIRPGNKQIGHSTLNKKHKRLVKQLADDGLIFDIQGVQLYSWKDSGVRRMLEAGVNIVDIMHHLRHQDLNMTQKYCKSLSMILRDIRQIDDDMPGIKA